jgi:hypothetical protein
LLKATLASNEKAVPLLRATLASNEKAVPLLKATIASNEKAATPSQLHRLIYSQYHADMPAIGPAKQQRDCALPKLQPSPNLPEPSIPICLSFTDRMHNSGIGWQLVAPL